MLKNVLVFIFSYVFLIHVNANAFKEPKIGPDRIYESTLTNQLKNENFSIDNTNLPKSFCQFSCPNGGFFYLCFIWVLLSNWPID